MKPSEVLAQYVKQHEMDGSTRVTIPSRCALMVDSKGQYYWLNSEGWVKYGIQDGILNHTTNEQDDDEQDDKEDDSDEWGRRAGV